MIARAEQLTVFVEKLRDTPWVAMDTEADSLHAYPEKICLIQISIPGRDVIVDPLTGVDLRPLWQTLKERELIMHGSDYDLRLLWRNHRFAPKTLFDTMLAARLLGYAMFGLGNLVAHHLGLKLEKGPQKANWALRPLSPRMEDYARNDSRHLKKLEEILRHDLEKLGRLEWHREMCARQVEQCTQDAEPDRDSLWRLKGSGRLDRRALAVLKSLWDWREEEAIDANRPPFFILPAETLVLMATRASDGQSVEDLVPRRFSPRRVEQLRRAVARAMDLPIEQCPLPAVKQATPRLTLHQRRQLEQLTQRRDARAADLKLDPTLIASRATLLNLATDGEAARRSLMNWQRNILF